jgi:hypothetical protein
VVLVVLVLGGVGVAVAALRRKPTEGRG